MAGADGVSIREQARLLGISKSEMARARAEGCPLSEEEAKRWRAAHRRPYLRSVSETYRELDSAAFVRDDTISGEAAAPN